MSVQLSLFVIEQTDSSDSRRRALRLFSTDSARATPAAQAFVATDTDADPLSERTASTLGTTAADSTTNGKEALPALASRRWFLLENQSDTVSIWWKFGTAITAGAGFHLAPGGHVSFTGDLPNDALMVICDAAETATVVAQQC